MRKVGFSLQGWRLSSWILGNGKTIKELAKVLVPAAVGWVITQDVTLTGAATLFGKFILDMIEYYIKDEVTP